MAETIGLVLFEPNDYFFSNLFFSFSNEIGRQKTKQTYTKFGHQVF